MQKHITFYLSTILVILILLFSLTTLNNFIADKNPNQEVINKEVPLLPPVQKDFTFPEKEPDLFAQYYDEADQILNTLSLEEKLSQMFIIPFSSIDNSFNYQTIGGFILYNSDLNNLSKNQVITKISNRQNKAQINYIMTIDEEGGTVSRLSSNRNLVKEKIPSPRTAYEEGGFDNILSIEEAKDKLLLELGFNLNLAPVADISTNENDFMYKRSIGLSPTETGKYISLVTKKAQELNFSTCLKHFPGYGSNGDTHKVQTIDNRKLSYLQENDFIPFKMGIEAGTPSILVSHNIITDIDKDYPASLSKKVIDILKNNLNYTGLIISDELSMDALDSYNTHNEVSTLAINAGNDLLITKEYQTAYESALESIKSGKISEQRIDESVRKILAWKIAYKII